MEIIQERTRISVSVRNIMLVRVTDCTDTVYCIVVKLDKLNPITISRTKA